MSNHKVTAFHENVHCYSQCPNTEISKVDKPLIFRKETNLNKECSCPSRSASRMQNFHTQSNLSQQSSTSKIGPPERKYTIIFWCVFTELNRQICTLLQSARHLRFHIHNILYFTKRGTSLYAEENQFVARNKNAKSLTYSCGVRSRIEFVVFT